MAITIALTLAWSSSTIAETMLTPAQDLSADAKTIARRGVPLIVLVSLAGCPHCEVVRRSYLLPLAREADTAQTPIVRQVEINGRSTLRDFGGNATTHAEFARRYKISLAPVVMFFDANGVMLTDPLVGSMIPDFYGAYFDAALAEARSKLRVPALVRP